MCSMPVVCVLLPRFELVVAAGAREALLQGPAALAPEPGREQLVGEVSAAAEAFGIHPGMRMGEALARCPRLALVPPDPVGVADAWERVLVALGDDRRRWSSPTARGWRASTRAACGACTAARSTGCSRPRARPCAGRASPRRGSAPGRRASARSWPPPRGRARDARASSRGAEAWPPSRVALLRHRPEPSALPEELERLGIATLGALAALPRAAVADRFGRTRAARPRPRAAGATRRCARAVPARSSRRCSSSRSPPRATQLERALGLLVDRLLARRERDGRTLRVVVLGAVLVEGGTWRERVVFREPLPMRGACASSSPSASRLLPAPAETLRLAVERFGPPHPAGACALRRFERPPPGAPARGDPSGARRRRPRGARCACWPSTRTRGSPSAAPC